MIPITKTACRAFFAGMPTEILKCFPDKITPIPDSLKGLRTMDYRDASIVLTHSKDTEGIGVKRAFMYLCYAARHNREAAKDMVGIPIFAKALNSYVRGVLAPRMKITTLARNRAIIMSMTRDKAQRAPSPARTVMEP